MQQKPFLSHLLALAALALSILGGYHLGRIVFPFRPQMAGLPPLQAAGVEAQVQNGIEASLEAYYADANRVVFQVRLQGDGYLDQVALLDRGGEYINAGVGYSQMGDPTLYLIDFGLVSPWALERLTARLEFSVVTSPGMGEALAHFSFPFDVPVHPARTFEPKRSFLSVSGVNILLDRVVITPAYAQAYLCYTKPSDGDWGVSGETSLEIDGQTVRLASYSLLFDSDYGDVGKGGEPGWTPPVGVGRCVKLGFPVGADDPHSLTLSIPALEQSMPEVIPEDQVQTAIRELATWEGIDMQWHVVDHGAYPEYIKLPDGMSEQQAYRKFIEALGYVYYGQWTFDVQLDPADESAPRFTTSTYGMPAPIPMPESQPRVAGRLEDIIRTFAISPNRQVIAFATSQGVSLYDLGSYALLREISELKNVFSLAWSPDGTKLGAGSLPSPTPGGSLPRVVVWDTATWEAVFTWESGEEATSPFGGLAWSPDGQTLAFSLLDRGLLIVDIESGKVVSEQADFLQPPQHITWSPDGSRLIATGDLGYGIRRWRVDTGESVRLYDPRAGASPIQLAWSPDGKRIASGHADGTVCFWTVATNQCDGLIYAHQNLVPGLAWSPNGKQLATGGGVIRIWDTSGGRLLTSFGQQENVLYIQLDWLDAHTLVSLEAGFADKTLTVIRFWDVDTGSILFEFQGGSGMFGE